MVYKLYVSKLFLTQSTDSHHCDRVRSRSCPTVQKPRAAAADAHMSSSDEILARYVAGDVAVRRRNHRTTLRTGGRRVLVVKDTLPNVWKQAAKKVTGGIMSWS